MKHSVVRVRKKGHTDTWLSVCQGDAAVLSSARISGPSDGLSVLLAASGLGCTGSHLLRVEPLYIQQAEFLTSWILVPSI